MKHHAHDEPFNYEKISPKSYKQEQKAGGFRCKHCKYWVAINPWIGTHNRNHCNDCLWSRHVDIKKGDRKSPCHGGMKPIGLTFKHEGYGRTGEIMLVHHCALCAKISINRIAADDSEHGIVELFEQSLRLPPALQNAARSQGIYLLDALDRSELMRQLFGESHR